MLNLTSPVKLNGKNFNGTAVWSEPMGEYGTWYLKQVIYQAGNTWFLGDWLMYRGHRIKCHSDPYTEPYKFVDGFITNPQQAQ